MRLGILTGGGDCPGLNAVIRAAVVRTIRTYDGHMLGFQDGWLGMLRNRVVELDLNAISGILPRGGTMLGTSRVDPFREAPGLEGIREALQLHGLDGVLVCGGDGTLAAASRLAAAGVPLIGIPKTIDNDVPGTDYSFGYDTALTTVVRAVDALHSTAESHDRVIVLEVMGRTTGWLALSAAIAGGADMAVCPEQPVSAKRVCDVIRQRKARGRDFSIVVVAEGARFEADPDGEVLEVPQRLDAFGRPRYGGIGERLAARIEKELQVETRTVTLGYVQRGGTPTAFDRLLGSRMGVVAVDLAHRAEFGRMVCLRGLQIESVPIEVVAQGPRPADPALVEVANVFFG
ncbi:MAG: 6-phosphofructokinase [Candidatus Eisenbacteria bacterium]|uniref:ATP-dependent 6-phosphofructokinase n=1 Tax=Eiseniibacteriota bacterium TaxID=2212470 RepID=A0A849SFR5_UNCEI|nr:6-phosphofructokinase [Candidatus Eisenbacteria bacterium]